MPQGRQEKDKTPILRVEHSSPDYHRLGETFPFPGGTAQCVSGFSTVGKSEIPIPSDHTHLVTAFVKNQAPVDGDFPTVPPRGTFVVDELFNRAWFRLNDGWWYVNLVGPF